VLVLGAVAGTVSGCGGGSGSVAATNSSGTATGPSTHSTNSPSPANTHFIAQADAICKRINSELGSIKANSASAQEVKRVVPRHAAAERRGLAALERLAVPSALARSWREVLADRRTLANELDQLVEATKTGDSAATKALAASKKRVHGELLKTATGAGFRDCGRVG
jgi:hypothetical protein